MANLWSSTAGEPHAKVDRLKPPPLVFSTSDRALLAPLGLWRWAVTWGWVVSCYEFCHSPVRFLRSRPLLLIWTPTMCLCWKAPKLCSSGEARVPAERRWRLPSMWRDSWVALSPKSQRARSLVRINTVMVVMSEEGDITTFLTSYIYWQHLWLSNKTAAFLVWFWSSLKSDCPHC